MGGWPTFSWIYMAAIPAGARHPAARTSQSLRPCLMRMAVQSALLGGHVRVGMEDNAFISKGVFAKSNAEQVRKIRGMIDGLGPSIATPAQAREILGLRPR